MSVQYRTNPSEVLQSSTIMMRRHLLQPFAVAAAHVFRISQFILQLDVYWALDLTHWGTRILVDHRGPRVQSLAGWLVAR